MAPDRVPRTVRRSRRAACASRSRIGATSPAPTAVRRASDGYADGRLRRRRGRRCSRVCAARGRAARAPHRRRAAASTREIVTSSRSSPALGFEDLALTTNASQLARLAGPLRDAGLQRINISIDTLDEARFRAVTRGGELGPVLAGIDAAIEAGLTPIKLNTVVLRGVNDDEIERLTALGLGARHGAPLPGGDAPSARARSWRGRTW